MGSNVIAASEKEATSRESASSAWRQNRSAPSIGELNSLTGSWRFSSPDVSDVAGHQPRTNRFYRATR